MKNRAILMFTFLFATLFSFAQRSNFTISTTGNSNLKIIFAGKKYSLQDRSCTFQNLTPGVYSLTVYQWQARQNGADYTNVYSGSVTLISGKHLELTVMRFGKAVWDERYIARDEWNDNAMNPQSDNGYGGGPHHDRNDENRIVADAEQFNKIKQAVNKEFSDADKLRMAKVTVKNVWLKTSQVKEIMNLFFDDNKKLEFAKYAYDYCSDKGNYFTLAEEFFSPANKNSLLDFISGR